MASPCPPEQETATALSRSPYALPNLFCLGTLSDVARLGTHRGWRGRGTEVLHGHIAAGIWGPQEATHAPGPAQHNPGAGGAHETWSARATMEGFLAESKTRIIGWLMLLTSLVTEPGELESSHTSRQDPWRRYEMGKQEKDSQCWQRIQAHTVGAPLRNTFSRRRKGGSWPLTGNGSSLATT